MEAEQLRKEIAELIPPGTDLDKWRVSTIIEHLSKKHNVDLGPQKKLVKQLVKEHVDSLDPDPAEAEADPDQDTAEAEEKVATPEPQVDKEGSSTSPKGANTSTPNGKVTGKRKRDDSEGVVIEGYVRRAAAIKSGLGKRARTNDEGRKRGENPCQLSAELAAIVGTDQLTRSEVITELGKYIDEQGLEKERTKIFCDEPLTKLLGVSVVPNLTSLHKYLKAHITEPEKKKSETKDGKKRGGGLQKQLLLSAKLGELVGQERMARTEVTKWLVAYIKEHNLQNPKKKTEILCDERLQSVLGAKKTTFFKMQKLLSAHIYHADE